ncbi:MAG: DUF1501 domain-containing protein [Rubrivivax sp.]|nr:DUF1501 domain-containing protein [Rubrivivax sp.]MBK8529970.1 DUF1501 domain-containing protein [Rubrivivax sp.]
MTHDHSTRRAFLRRAGHLAMLGGAMPLGLNLAALGDAAALTASDYKALVCVFLFGGNDHANTVVSYDATDYARYRAIRSAGASSGFQGIHLERQALAGTVLRPTAALPGGRQYALHPAMARMAGLFNSGRAAALMNVGPLVQPTTKAQYFNADRRAYPLPPKLYSHNDQASIWQSSSPEGATIGWGGRLGDLALAAQGHSLFTCITISGNGLFLSGDMALQYACSTAGPVPLGGHEGHLFGSTATHAAALEIIQAPSSHMLGEEYQRVARRAVQARSTVAAALAPVQVNTPFDDGSRLAPQLRMVARLIAARQALGVKRQVFLCSIGGFDLHDQLLSLQPGLLTEVSDAMTAFHDATVELGVADSVTAFTASDFGRALSSNGNGTDHGWGGHHFVVGGAVKGAAFYGTPPPVSVGNTSSPDDQWHVGNGRLLPTTSVDQMAATLGRWFGAADSELDLVLPNLRRFGGSQAGIDYPRDVGFMR